MIDGMGPGGTGPIPAVESLSGCEVNEPHAIGCCLCVSSLDIGDCHPASRLTVPGAAGARPFEMMRRFRGDE
ncbi:hypothetical protein BMG523Draft_01348 [Frankia sp. BMG5.23]|nr:hypothetical protein BMG523Draft_01348 [Frankia sp. BMG5.23]